MNTQGDNLAMQTQITSLFLSKKYVELRINCMAYCYSFISYKMRINSCFWEMYYWKWELLSLYKELYAILHKTHIEWIK